ncbi:MAG: gliding motility-associated C-terminal domain-containing protein [Bacteroidia bacterium]|nr:gliding motility-associated C-terminal domain-containing protein [Bacteroidia bacterium]
MYKSFTIILLIFIGLIKANATHNRAGEITLRQIGQYEYELTLVTFTYTLCQADRPELMVFWGDGTNSVIPRNSKVALPNYYQRNIYIGTHKYAGPGVFEIVMLDQNRNEGVENIPGSVNVPFTVKTTLMINPLLGNNSTPVLLTPPIDMDALGKVFVHNPTAWDPDNDSLSYKLSVCLGENGEPIPGYTLPPASDSITVNEYTGDLVWAKPTQIGIYNVAILIEEWRDTIKIGQIVRDMQIEVKNTDNNAPVITPMQDLCVTAGTNIQFIVSAIDQDLDNISLSAFGGPLFMGPDSAIFILDSTVPGYSSGTFSWQTNCSHIRRQPYQIVFKAVDDDNDVELVDFKSLNILIVCPPVENLSAESTNNSVKINWTPDICQNINGYKVFRRASSYSFSPDSCQTGLPSETGYAYIGKTENWSDTSFLDNNNGTGLTQGYIYCYRIVSYFEDEYLVYRSNDYWGNNSALIDSLDNINDTTYHDISLNTIDYPYSYKVEFYNDSIGKRFLIGAPQVTSSVYLITDPGDNRITININKNVPWINEKYIVYRKNNFTQSFDSIGFTTSLSYTDNNLKNGEQYCYYVKSIGGYMTENIIYPLINFSQKICTAPVDTVPTCSPELDVTTNCDSLRRNFLNWTNPNMFCSDDAVKYRIWYSPYLDQQPVVIDTVINIETTSYTHYPLLTIAGCYQVTAIDSFGNESPANSVCIDVCSYYELPNVFTPNGDGMNDIFKPGEYYFVEKIDMKIFNRWGQLVFMTDNPDINWDGKHIDTHKFVPNGIYYYICDVYEYRLTGIEPRTITGFIHIYGDSKDKLH